MLVTLPVLETELVMHEEAVPDTVDVADPVADVVGEDDMVLESV